MENLLATIDARKEELAKLGPLRTEDEERLWKKFRLEWNYNSNHIEGNTLTYQETELILIFDQAPGGSHTVREIEEMKAHDVAIALVREWAADEKRVLTEADIRDLNRILLVRPFWKEALTFDGQPTRRLISIGEYKKYPNSVRLSNGEMFHYASPEETPRKMQELLTWYRDASQKQHPVIVAARLHYDFVRIHPFDDGNGRGARLLMNYHLLRHGFPPVIIKSADKKDGYFAALQRADVGDFEAFITYIVQQMQWSLDLKIREAKGESVEESGDWGKQVTLLKREAEGKKVNSARLMLNRKENIVFWLQKNFSVLKKEMENRFSVFNQFFQEHNYEIVIIENIGGRQIDLLAEEISWTEFVNGLEIGKYNPTITLIYSFKEFLYGEKKEFKEVEPSFPITIMLLDNKIRISSSLKAWGIDIQDIEKTIDGNNDLKEPDLQPIHKLAQKLYEQIENAIGKS